MNSLYAPPPFPPPPRDAGPPRRSFKKWLFVIAACAVLFVGGVSFAIYQLFASGITKGPDNMFGDQHLKTSVALIELHKVRYGKYPDKLSDLKFTGQWDQIALQSVRYYPNADRTAYYIEVERGWVGKPALSMPDEFWQGTGYSAALKPSAE